MKKILVSILLILTLLAFAFPAAASSKTPVGERININLGTPTIYPAKTPFYIAHGWNNLGSPPPLMMGVYTFKLQVDGVYQQATYVERTVDKSATPNVLNFRWVFNFPNGMTGTHTFTGHWIGPCAALVALGYYSGPCSNPAAPIEFNTKSLTVDFQ